MGTVSEFHAEDPQAIASEGLVQGPYVAARTGYEPATLQTKGTESTNEPSRPTKNLNLPKFSPPHNPVGSRISTMGSHCHRRGFMYDFEHDGQILMADEGAHCIGGGLKPPPVSLADYGPAAKQNPHLATSSLSVPQCASDRDDLYVS